MTRRLRLPHLEPPPWLYTLLSRGFVMQDIHGRFALDLAGFLPPQAALLDVGTGPGFLLKALARLRPDVRLTGLDLSYQMLRHSRRVLAGVEGRPARRLVQADAQALPFPARTFEVVVATFSLHIWPEPAKGVAECARVLKPRGWGLIYELQREATRAGIKALARQLGLPAWLLYPGFRILSLQHALRSEELKEIALRAGVPRARVRPVHHVFWRLEFEAPAAP